MNAVAPAWPADRGGDQPSGRLGRDSRWDRRVALLDGEAAALLALGPVGLRRNRGVPRRTAPQWNALARLVEPLDETLAALHHGEHVRYRRAGAHAAGAVLQHCADSGRSWWGWAPWEWARLCGTSAREFVTAQTPPTESTVRPYVVALAYLLGGFTDFHRLGTFNRLHLACLIFGEPAVEESLQRAGEVLDRWGYRDSLGKSRMRGVFSQALLLNRSPRLDDLSTASFAALRTHPATDGHQGSMLYALQRVVAALGYCDPPVRTGYNHATDIEGTDPAWADWIERWYATSTLTPKVRATFRTIMAKAGRWLAAEHPEITEPGQWTRATCAAWVAAVDRMSVGDWVQRRDALGGRVGEAISPRTKAQNLVAARTFFRDCQEWEWIPRRFDPNRALALPRSVAALIGTNPRVIADEVWAKLLWAGLNLATRRSARQLHLLSDGVDPRGHTDLAVLRAAQRRDRPAAGGMHPLAARRPAHRRRLARDPRRGRGLPARRARAQDRHRVHQARRSRSSGQAIEAWQALRPSQPKRLDRKTKQHVHMLFSVRAQPVAKVYINHTIIPALCAKAGVPTADVRGNITSHRARSTIASQLYNAKEPMTLFELQAWLGHRTPNTTQHYAKITPNTLSKAYSEAGYFARNVRTIEVLIDRDAVTSGAAAAGEPWQHYDLGHGWCTYTFFEQCPHRMACARCDFYTPKDSTKAQLLEAKDNLQRMRATIPLTDDERAAVDDGHTAVTALLDRLADVPTPAGPTPRELGTPPTVTMLPIVQIRTGNSS